MQEGKMLKIWCVMLKWWGCHDFAFSSFLSQGSMFSRNRLRYSKILDVLDHWQITFIFIYIVVVCHSRTKFGLVHDWLCMDHGSELPLADLKMLIGVSQLKMITNMMLFPMLGLDLQRRVWIVTIVVFFNGWDINVVNNNIYLSSKDWLCHHLGNYKAPKNK